jgi:hypothetical protein
MPKPKRTFMSDAMMKSVCRAAAVTALLLGSTGFAHADAIDGHWCSTDGKRMSIAGPQIVTPGGTAIRGDYSRHFFSYVIPAGEPGTGNTVSITLLGEYLAHSREGASDAPVKEWRRCQADVS